MNTIEKMGEDGYPIYGADFKLVDGMRIGKLIVNGKGSKPKYFKCTCDCGAVVEKRQDNLKAGALRGGSAAQKNKGCRTCGAEACNKSGIKNRNIAGSIISSHTDTNVGGAKILYETDYIDTSNRSTIIICECSRCGKPFPTTKRSQASGCGCAIGKPTPSLEDFVAQRQCSSRGEEMISKLLTKMKLNFVMQKKYDDLVDVARLPFDFFVSGPNGNYIIEYDGKQHFKDIKYFNFKTIRKHDLMKNQYCFTRNIPIIHIPFTVVDVTEQDVALETSKYILTPENQKEYYA